jgi:mannose/fructose-specific phosphotransferase system component IIA
MNHIIVLTHGDFCEGIAQSCRFILGDVADIHTISIRMDSSIESVIEMLEAKVFGFGDAPVIVATDIPGGSTSQAALSILPGHSNMYLVTGLNLGLLLELALMDIGDDLESNLNTIREAVKEVREQLMLLNDTIECTDESVLEEDGEL